MNLKKLILAAATGTALIAASAVQARDDHYRGNGYGNGYGHYGYHHRHAARVYVRPAPYYYMPPAPVYYTPPPAPVYYEPRPVIFGSLPIGNSRVRIGVAF